MKTILASVALYLFFVCPVIAQTSTRKVSFKSIGKDSVNLHFDPDYFLIEDTCSSIVRYGHYNFQKRHFFGEFRDLNKLDPMIVLAEGRYNLGGKLDGPFETHHLNGQPQAKGRFEDGLMVGDWSFFFEDGTPKLFLKDSGGQLIVQRAHNSKGESLVKDGAGEFRVEQGNVFWQGKLLNGLPEGTWKCRQIDDRTGTVLSTEVFKDNKFVKGSGPLGRYTDASRMVLISSSLVPINNAALTKISATACDPSLSRHKIIYPVYRNGFESFNEEIKRLVGPVFAKKELRVYGDAEFDIDGEINEKGFLNNLKPKHFDERLTSAIIKELQRLPALAPGLINGKAVKTKISFHFKMTNGLYSFRYRFKPLSYDNSLSTQNL